MQLHLIRHLWGVSLEGGWTAHLEKWRQVGYTGLEVSLRHLPAPAAFRRILREEKWHWIPQVYSNTFTPGGTVRAHFDSIKEQIEECLPESPLLFNAHSGSDAWGADEAVEFYGRCLELEKKIGIPVAHETHRGRYLNTPWKTRDLLEALPDLKLTCDFSHWVCVCERLLPDCESIIRLAARACHHVHARVGYEQGPQVGDPRAPEYARHLAAHEEWWRLIWEMQVQQGFSYSTLTPEFGPPNYQQTAPYSQKPVADVAEICDWMAERQKTRFLEMGRTLSSGPGH
jgi:hypothetical protein